MSDFIPVVTTTLGTTPELAPSVNSGLASGAYERVGGVIRNATTKQIVTFLRDTTGGSSAASNALSPILSFNAAASVLNLSITAVGFAIVMQRLESVERRLVSISKQLEGIGRKLDLSISANLRAAVELVRTSFAMSGESNRQAAATQAINRLLEIEHVYIGLVDMEFDSGGWAVSPLLNSVMLASVSASRCYLELGEMETARRHLVDANNVLTPRVHRYYESVVGVNPAIYLHPKLAEQISLVRMTNIQRWERTGVTESQVFEGLRPAIWETASQNPESWLKKLPKALWRHEEDGEKKLGPVKMRRSSEEIYERLLPRLPEAFGQVEEAFESLGRVRGFEGELEFLLDNNISYADWQQLKIPVTNAEDGIVYVMPEKSPLLHHSKKLLTSEDKVSKPNS